MFFLCNFCSTLNAQVLRSGVMKCKLYSVDDSSFYFLEIDYFSKEKIAITKKNTQGIIVEQGYLNRVKSNIKHENFTIIYYDDCTSSQGIITDGYNYFNPMYLFKDTAKLLYYDYSNLSRDGDWIISQMNGKKDTVNYKIFYQQQSGKFYSVIIGKYVFYYKNGLIFKKGDNKHLFEDIFNDKASYYNKKGELTSEENVIYSHENGRLFKIDNYYTNKIILNSKIEVNGKEEYQFDKEKFYKR